MLCTWNFNFFLRDWIVFSFTYRIFLVSWTLAILVLEVIRSVCIFLIWTELDLFSTFSYGTWFSNLSITECIFVIFNVAFSKSEYKPSLVYRWSWILSGMLIFSRLKSTLETFSWSIKENLRVFISKFLVEIRDNCWSTNFLTSGKRLCVFFKACFFCSS